MQRDLLFQPPQVVADSNKVSSEPSLKAEQTLSSQCLLLYHVLQFPKHLGGTLPVQQLKSEGIVAD